MFLFGVRDIHGLLVGSKCTKKEKEYIDKVIKSFMYKLVLKMD